MLGGGVARAMALASTVSANLVVEVPNARRMASSGGKLSSFPGTLASCSANRRETFLLRFTASAAGAARTGGASSAAAEPRTRRNLCLGRAWNGCTRCSEVELVSMVTTGAILLGGRLPTS